MLRADQLVLNMLDANAPSTRYFRLVVKVKVYVTWLEFLTFK